MARSDGDARHSLWRRSSWACRASVPPRLSAEADRAAKVIEYDPRPTRSRINGRRAGSPLDKVSDGCGQADSAFRANHQTYHEHRTERSSKSTSRTPAPLHDAAYSGALVWDRINGQFVDFSDPYWTKDRINHKFKLDLQRMCFRNFPPGQDAPGAPWKMAL